LRIIASPSTFAARAIHHHNTGPPHTHIIAPSRLQP
jgi:hypothetical protein